MPKQPEMPQQPRASGGRSDAAAAPEMAPDQRPITRSQAEHLAQIAGVPAEKLAGQPIAILEDVLRWKIEPSLLLFRRVCGRVVRRDPATGVVQGVPNATVHVEDTDCSFLGFFPVENPWWWLWPVSCRREVIATTTTDQCGRFCVLIPRWDIDRILRFRLERVCFPDIFRPNLRDFVRDALRRIPRPPFPPFPPEPAPPPFRLPGPQLIRQLAAHAGPGVADRLLVQAQQRTFGESNQDLGQLLEARAFAESLPAPVTDEALMRLAQLDPGRQGDVGDKPPRDEPGRERPVPRPGGRAEGQPEGRAEGQAPDRGWLNALVRTQRPIGPFLRCRDVLVAEWHFVVDVPDITFRVTQDVDLDGDEETIYGEGFFDVRWNAGSIPNVVLEASAIARPSALCSGPSIPCTDVAAIRTVGLMPLEPSHHDAATGYSVRVNRPRPGGLSSSPPAIPAQAPYAGTLQLHGCHRIGGAVFYRLLYAYEAAGFVPFTGLEWWAPRLGPGAPFHIVPDADGWYPVLPAGDLVFPHWLLNWPSYAYPNGRYRVKLQLGNAAKTVIAPDSAEVAFEIDNRAPNAGFSQIRWRTAGGAWLAENVFPWPFMCPVIRRPAGTDIEIEVSWWASAIHFRNAVLSGGGCGGGNPSPIGPPSDFDHWHISPADNAVTRTALFGVSGMLPEGSYTFSVDAHTRAFNPAGDGGGPGTNWYTDYAYSHAHPSVAISIIST